MRIFADACLELAYLEEARGNRIQAEKFVWESYEINKNLEDKGRLAANYSFLGWLASSEGNLDDAELFHGYALEWHRGVGDRAAQAVDEQNLGNVYRRQGRLLEAEKRLRAAIRLQESKEARGGGYHDLAMLFLESSRETEAERALLRAISLLRDAEPSVVQGLTALQIGNIHAERGEWESARGRFEEALRVLRLLQRPLHVAVAAVRLAWICDRSGEARRADRLVIEALHSYEAAGERAPAVVYARAASLSTESGDVREAEKLWRAAVQAFQLEGNQEGVAHSRSSLGYFLVRIGRVPEAISQWHGAMNAYRDLDMLDRVKELRSLCENAGRTRRQ